jgi:uncharacterized protein (DUF433 family)
MNEYPHIEERDESYYIRGQRIPLRTVVIAWNAGDSPETIRRNFPTLSLADVYGGVVYYLDHREMLDAHFAEISAQEEAIFAELDAKNAEFRAKIRQRAEASRAQREESAS